MTLRRAAAGFAAVLVFAGAQALAANPCEQGESALAKSDFPQVVSAMTACLADAGLGGAQRRRALQARAWGHFSLHHERDAVADQEASYKLAPPSAKSEYINYSSYLRRVARYQDSLRALQAAAAMDSKAGTISMQTQYNLGWTLSELRRYDEAISAFSAGIPQQPDFPFAYYRRALAYEATGKLAEARSDLERAATLMVRNAGKFPEDAFVAALRAKVKEYQLGDKYKF